MKTGKALILPEYNDNLLRAMLGLKVEERITRDPMDDEVLVKMQGTPCNPSDIAFLRGGYNIVKDLPCVPGFEATGIVVEAGSGALDLLNKRISCFIRGDQEGSWAEYFLAKKSDCFIVKDQLPMEEAACLSINPFTAWGLFEYVLEQGSQAFIQNAAGGQVAGQLRQLAKINGVEVINLVRKEEHVELMKAQGIKNVLNTSENSFQDKLFQLTTQLKPLIAFDAVGGEIGSQMLNVMPPSSRLVVYGALSGSLISGIDPMGVIFSKKLISGFNLNDWLDNLDANKLESVTEQIQDLMIASKMSTEIQGKFKLDEAVKGLRSYIKSMSSGKILFTP